MRRCIAPCLALLIVGCADSITPPSNQLLSLGPDVRASVISAWTPIAITNAAPRFLPGVTTGPDGRVYAFGGQIGSLSTQATAEVYDAGTNTWSFIAPMPTRRANHAAVLGSDGLIYNVSGLVIVPPSTFSAASVSVDRYNAATNTWSTGPSLPGAPRFNVNGTAGLDGRVYVAGGLVSGAFSNNAFVFDPATGLWTTLPNMPTARSSFAMATGPSGRIYALGGTIGNSPTLVATANVDAYDPTTNTWTTVAPLPGTRGLHSATTGADGRIYVFGGTPNGFQSPGFLMDAFAYDETTNTWSPVPAPSVGRVAARATLGGDGRIYFVGGTMGSTTPPINEVFGPVCNQSPAITLSVSPTELWPPNHKMVTVATGISTTDDCGAPSLVVTVSSNEPTNGTGDGNTSSDWLVTDNGDGTFNVAVRSERSGTGNGRVYTITATAMDGDGNVTVSSGTVTVPKKK